MATSCACRWSASSSPRRRARASAPTRRTIPTTADIADLVGSVDLAKVAQIGDEGDPRAWSWSGAVYSASRGLLEMIEILKVKREFLYLLLTMTQEKNVKVSRFPLIHLDETILAHTNLAEFHKFLQEKENEALLDRMVIIKVPYALSYKDESRIYQKLVSGAPAFRNVHLDPHVLNLASVFSILTRLAKPEREGLDMPKKLRLYAGEAVEGVPETEAARLRSEVPDEGLTGVSPRFVINAISNAITRSNAHSLTSMELLLALKDSIESDARMDAKQKKGWIDHLVTARKEFYNRWVKEDVHRAMFASFEEEAQQLLEKYLDEVEASLDHRQVTDPDHRRDAPGGRALPALGRGEDQGVRLGQAVVPPGSGAQGDGRLQGRREVQALQPRAHARGHRAVSVRGAARRAAAGDLHRAAGRRSAAEDLGGAAAADQRVWLRRAQREGSAELRHDLARAGVARAHSGES